MTTPRIFVQIASYRDPELQWTVKDMFEKAAKPERVFAGICWQFDPELDNGCFAVPYPRPDQVRVVNFHHKDSKGACWARSHTQSLWRDEEFTLQIDSHMRFEPGWDETLLAQHAACDSARAVLTAYPPGYTPPDRVERGWVFTMIAKEFDKNGIFLMTSHGVREQEAPEVPMPGAFLSGCFFFGPSQIIKDVPYDPHLYFFGEEISMAVRLWTHGWDLFHPSKIVLFHDWNRGRRTTHFDDDKAWMDKNKLSFARVKHMLGTELSKDPAVLREMDRYGLGTARSLKEYQEFSGIHFNTKSIEPKARHGRAYHTWRGAAANAAPPTVPVGGQEARAPAVVDNLTHRPKKMFESAEGIVYDDFLPEDVYEKIYRYFCQCDFEYINTKGVVSRAWHIRDGFPLRGTLNAHYFPDDKTKPQGDWVYPTKTGLDVFIDQMNRILPEVRHFVGSPGRDWDRFSVTPWLYPMGTALSLHDDGSGVYAGAYAYFVNPYWNVHWGGLLMLMDAAANREIIAHKKAKPYEEALFFHKKKWLDDTDEQAFMWDPGFAKCVFPKRNRIAFINNDAYHMVTKVNPEAGENHRMSLAGFFSRKK